MLVFSGLDGLCIAGKECAIRVREASAQRCAHANTSLCEWTFMYTLT